MEKVKIGIIGIGNMGVAHAQYLKNGEIKGAELCAVCDINPERLQWAKKNFGDSIFLFEKEEDLLASDMVDAVLIATPHYSHPALAIKAFEYRKHVLIEKPAGVFTKQVSEMNLIAEKSGLVFSIMYNRRTDPLYQKVRDLIINGELGEIRRMIWIITTWYRPQSYYDSCNWRGTWEGEGGGVLINQDPHQLDLWQWICGMPKRIRSFCYFGKYHNIEVEDDVTAYAEYENGATALFVTTTGEAPGTDRLEISGDRGKIIVENGAISFWRLRVSERQFNSEYKGGFGRPECWKCEIPVYGNATEHKGITQNWVDSILHGVKLLSPGVEGINGLLLSNAILLSSWKDNWVDIPFNEDEFCSKLQKKIKESHNRKEEKQIVLDVSGTHF